MAGLSPRSRLLAREGDSITAVALAQRVEELAATSDSPIYHGDAAPNLAEVLSLTGDRAGAEQAVRRAVSCYYVAPPLGVDIRICRVGLAGFI